MLEELGRRLPALIFEHPHHKATELLADAIFLADLLGSLGVLLHELDLAEVVQLGDGRPVFGGGVAQQIGDQGYLLQLALATEQGLPGCQLHQDAAQTPYVSFTAVGPRPEQHLRAFVPSREAFNCMLLAGRDFGG